MSKLIGPFQFSTVVRQDFGYVTHVNIVDANNVFVCNIWYYNENDNTPEDAMRENGDIVDLLTAGARISGGVNRSR